MEWRRGTNGKEKSHKQEEIDINRKEELATRIPTQNTINSIIYEFTGVSHYSVLSIRSNWPKNYFITTLPRSPTRTVTDNS